MQPSTLGRYVWTDPKVAGSNLSSFALSGIQIQLLEGFSQDWTSVLMVVEGAILSHP